MSTALSATPPAVRLDPLPAWRPPFRALRCRELPADEWLPGGAYEEAPGSVARLPRVLQGLSVLVVDDDEETIELFAAALTACGARVTTATGARDALSALALDRPDVVVSDIAMRGGDGYWLVREMARLTDTGIDRVPVIAVTAYGREHSRTRVLGAGFVDHLQKPVDPEALCRAVAGAAGR